MDEHSGHRRSELERSGLLAIATAHLQRRAEQDAGGTMPVCDAGIPRGLSGEGRKQSEGHSLSGPSWSVNSLAMVTSG